MHMIQTELRSTATGLQASPHSTMHCSGLLLRHYTASKKKLTLTMCSFIHSCLSMSSCCPGRVRPGLQHSCLILLTLTVTLCQLSFEFVKCTLMKEKSKGHRQTQSHKIIGKGMVHGHIIWAVCITCQDNTGNSFRAHPPWRQNGQ